MRRGRTTVVVALVAAAMVGSVVALPALSGGSDPLDVTDGATTETANDPAAAGESQAALEAGAAQTQNASSELVAFEEADATDDDGTNAQAAIQGDSEAAVESGVEEGVELVQSQGIEVTQEQRAAALEGARSSVAQHQSVEAEQVQAATKGAVHGSLIQSQSVNATQIQYAVGGATDGGLSQSQSANVTQLQSATWGATHGALAQSQNVSVEQIQAATRGAAAGATKEAGASDVGKAPHVQEAAQGSAYGVLTQYRSITVEQRQRVTLEHVQHAAAGGAAGSLAGSSPAALEGEQRVDARQEQRVDVEQRQRVTIKQIQKAAAGASKGALVQKQSVSVEQTQAAARGASRGSLKQVQSVRLEQSQSTRLEQRQRISITQVQEATFGAAKGAISQSQSATVEQIQAAADGSAGGVLVQRQSISITQIQYAAVGAAEGAVTSAIQRQEVTIEQIQAAAFGAGEGAVTQTQLVEVTQVQRLAHGGASGALVQAQSATVAQIQIAARSACQETAHAVQSQRISITQLQRLTQESASEATAYAVGEETDDVTQITQHVDITVTQRLETIDRIEGTASIDVPDQESDGERVTIEDASLSEGGFVAVYEGLAVDADPDAIIGVSEYLEAGDHENVTIELDEPLEENGSIVAVTHHDTNDDGTFRYAESDGDEDVPYVSGAGAPVIDGAFVTVTDEPDEPDEATATLSVADQRGDGETLTVDEANASVPYAVTASYDGETTESDRFAAGEAVSNLSLELEPPLEANATVNVSVVDENGTALANDSLEYTVANDTGENETDPEASLSVDNQTGDGGTLTVDAASASVPYVLAAEYDGERVESDEIEANATVSDEVLDLEPPLEENATVDVSVRAAADDAVLANESIEYAVEEPDPDEPTANLSVADQTGDGETLTVTQANASVEYAITVADGNGTQLATSETFGANETIGPEEFDLEPPLAENTTLEVAVVAADDGTPIETADVDYTVDGAPAGFDVEFVNCQRAVVTASLEEGDRVAASTWFYTSGGVGDTIAEDLVTAGDEIPAPYNGTIVFEIGTERDVTTDGEQVIVEVPDYGTFGTYISGISSPEAAPVGGIDYPNPSEACNEEVRPELPSIALEETTPTEDGIDVTFSYENPNDASMGANSRFVEGNTTDQPPSGFEPGQQTFTVEWTPESDDERLVWEADFSNFGYEEPITAETPTAGEIEPSDPAAFGVSIAGTNSPVERGESLEVEADLENVGGEDGTQTVSLAIGDTTIDATSVSLESGETETVSFTAETDGIEPGEYPLTVSTANETAETTVTVEEPPAPAAFGVSIAGTNSPVEQGEPIAVETVIENVGDRAGTQALEVAVDGVPSDPIPVTLESGETQTVTLNYGTADLEPGEYILSVSTENQTAETTVAVDAVPEAGAQADGNGETGPDGEAETPPEPEQPTEPEQPVPPEEPEPEQPEQPEQPAPEQPNEPGPDADSEPVTDGNEPANESPPEPETNTRPAETTDGGAAETADDETAETTDGGTAETANNGTTETTDGGTTDATDGGAPEATEDGTAGAEDETAGAG
ncbi:hypothetical protein CP556_12430 [Natrinema sp. CBA1119]|uniref:DUF7282 domain-containing protein n=1 Tax=Natrinema sp. CBA1119 TaxID=1608465 RepID=UPI000BF4E43F|nr:hypothetical protein [Natrinema sp. CBA1119]PGF16845.1 hypothetical protein CP556_12430 [Natrinema sp. CBA1119]